MNDEERRAMEAAKADESTDKACFDNMRAGLDAEGLAQIDGMVILDGPAAAAERLAFEAGLHGEKWSKARRVGTYKALRYMARRRREGGSDVE